MSYSKEELSVYRIERAKRTIEEAKLLANSEYWNSTANRLYYACFYVASAYLILYEIEASTHKGIKTAFNNNLIKTGKLSKEFGQLYNKLFNLRQDADYRDFKEVKGEKIIPLMAEVELLIQEIEGLINKAQ